MDIIVLLVAFGLILFGFNWLMGYKKNHIVIDFDERYQDYKEYIGAIQRELVNQGRVVSYKGNSRFLIDGQVYVFVESNISMGGAPLQRTILKPEKGDSEVLQQVKGKMNVR
ncbi:hypothetical protein [Halobacillus naozhouensis]|uniref:Uncharacterized protein n=1 Tax=Halobacillus naozhouensis TaxID=554880 RepID=A0ABY8IYC6_9BACI|nr:hypothetical protein [Halobacillus naozhouensis]WFT75239.1 hypothetical protein P9989_02170 [Halobacillus naozhouensis]